MKLDKQWRTQSEKCFAIVLQVMLALVDQYDKKRKWCFTTKVLEVLVTIALH